MNKRFNRAVAVLVAMLSLGVAGVIGGASPASASVCELTGSGVQTWNWWDSAGQQHKLCARVIYQDKVGDPNWCWESWWVQEVIDYGGDQNGAILQTRTLYPSGSYTTRGIDWGSVDATPNSGFRLINKPQGVMNGCALIGMQFRVSFTGPQGNAAPWYYLTPLYAP